MSSQPEPSALTSIPPLGAPGVSAFAKPTSIRRGPFWPVRAALRLRTSERALWGRSFMVAYQVSTRLNSPSNNDASLAAPVDTTIADDHGQMPLIK